MRSDAAESILAPGTNPCSLTLKYFIALVIKPSSFLYVIFNGLKTAKSAGEPTLKGWCSGQVAVLFVLGAAEVGVAQIRAGQIGPV